jgi:hypothetical protein
MVDNFSGGCITRPRRKDGASLSNPFTIHHSPTLHQDPGERIREYKRSFSQSSDWRLKFGLENICDTKGDSDWFAKTLLAMFDTFGC